MKERAEGGKLRASAFDEKLKVKGGFLDLMKAAVKDANSKNKKKP